MEETVRLRSDDGGEADLPLALLPYFPALAAMVTDIGHPEGDTVLPISNGSGTSSVAELLWVIAFYVGWHHYFPESHKLSPEVPVEAAKMVDNVNFYLHDGLPPNFLSLYKPRATLASLSLGELLGLNQFVHYNDCRAVEMVTLSFLKRRLLEEDPPVEGPTIALEDVPLWSRQPMLADYLLRVMPYARRYRQLLTFMRSLAHNVSHGVVQLLTPPTMTPLSCGNASTMIITPQGILACGATRSHALGIGPGVGRPLTTFSRVQGLEGEVITFSCGATESMVITSEGLFSCGEGGGGLGFLARPTFERENLAERARAVSCGAGSAFVITVTGSLLARGGNANGQLGLGNRVTRHGFQKVAIIGEALQVVCRNNSALLITDTGLYAAGVNRYGELGLGDMVERTSFVRVLVEGRVLSLAQGGWHAMLLTTEGLFATGSNSSGQRGLHDQRDRDRFERVGGIQGEPLSVACGASHSMLITTVGLFACGSSNAGRLGTGPIAPVNVGHFERVTIQGTPFAVACGNLFTMLLTTEGLFATGVNESGQLGLGLDTFHIQHSFTLVSVPGLPIRALQEEPETKKRRLGCRLCGATSGLHQELQRPDRVFCGEGLCHRKFHYFDQLLRL